MRTAIVESKKGLIDVLEATLINLEPLKVKLAGSNFTFILDQSNQKKRKRLLNKIKQTPKSLWKG